jgi:hypothetical protein
MEGIYQPNDAFDFSNLVVSKPTRISGGNYFIRLSYLENPLYIQPPKSTTKQGILKAGKRHYCDLLFSNEQDGFTRWMENLEQYLQKRIFENRSEWFDGEMELHDIENYFTPPLKTFKSGKFYLVRVNISPILGKTPLKIYDEYENELSIESITDETNIMTILEIQGVKCSAKSFYIEIELKQIMVLNTPKLFEKCILKGAIKNMRVPEEENIKKDLEESKTELPVIDETTIDEHSSDEVVTDASKIEENPENSKHTIQTGLEEIDFDLEELPKTDKVQLRERKEVYYEIYKKAVKKAKIAREMAISAYLEAKQIKNTYMIEDLDNESDLDEDEFSFSNMQKEE